MKNFKNIIKYDRRIIKFYFGSCIKWIGYLLKNPIGVCYIRPWHNTSKSELNVSNDKTPWIVYPAKRWLDFHLTSDMSVFEWGSGGSTIYFSKRVKQLISIEHDPTWFSRVMNRLKAENYSNYKYYLSEGKKIENLNVDFKNPYSYYSSDPNYQQMSFENYVKSIDAFEDNYFDLIFIDGRARPSCILHAKNKLKKGGFLVLDNSERTEYIEGKKLLKNWKCIKFFGPGPYVSNFWETTIWIKP